MMGSASVDQVEEGKQIDPDQVDKVPVERREIDCGEVLLAEVAALVATPDPDQNTDAHQDVESVDAGHYEIDAEENVRFCRQIRHFCVGGNRTENAGVLMTEVAAGQEPFVELVAVLEVFDAEKDERAGDGDEQERR